MIRSLIVAMAGNRVIGRGNQLPWRLPADLAHFKRLTMGHPVIMGRRTHESIGKILPGRQNIVVSRTTGFVAPGCTVVDSLGAAFAAANGAREAFVIGGSQLYSAALAEADRIHLTVVDAVVPGDAFFPELDPSDWRETQVGTHPADDRNPYGLRFLQLERIQ